MGQPMKTFTATDARNRFGEFLDSGMVDGEFQGKVPSTETMADLHCDRRGLTALIAYSRLLRPRLPRERAEAMA